jgi:hypothetical protein
VDLTTIKGIIRARWWVILGAAILAVIVSGRLAEYRNDHLPTFEAVSSVTFIEDPQALERDDFVTFLDNQFALAQDVNSDVLDETPGSFIPWLLAEVALEDDQNQIQFVGRGYTQQEASDLSEFMRDRFLAASTIGAGQERMSRELEDLTEQIGQLRAEINERLASEPLTPEELTLQTERAALENQITALEAHYGGLTVELMNPVLRTADQIRGEMGRTFDQLKVLREQLATYPPAPLDPTTVDPALAEDEQVLLDQLRLQNLEARWQQLYIGQRELQALASVGEVDEQPVTLDAASPTTNQAMALAGALVVALLGLIAVDRGRGVMWSENDLEEDGPIVMVDMPSRDLKVFKRPNPTPWYVATTGGRRKTAIQMLRSQLDDKRNSVIAFQGTGVLRMDILEMAADTAVAIAVSGRSVLLVDATFRPHNGLAEFEPNTGPSLVGLLTTPAVEREEILSEYKDALVSRPETVNRLRTLRSGSGELEAADALAGYKFELLLGLAREMFDVVIVAGADLGEAASHVLAQRVDSVVLVASAGHSSTRAIESADRDFATSRARLRGIALLRRRRNRLVRWLGTKTREMLWGTIDGFSDRRSRKDDESPSSDD